MGDAVSALVISKWNGQIHLAVEHGPASSEPRLGEEELRMHNAESDLPLSKLRILYAGYVARVALQVAA